MDRVIDACRVGARAGVVKSDKKDLTKPAERRALMILEPKTEDALLNDVGGLTI